MICPICSQKCSEHRGELGQWYDCPDHGLVALIRYEESNPLAEAARHDEYVDAMERSREATI